MKAAELRVRVVQFADCLRGRIGEFVRAVCFSSSVMVGRGPSMWSGWPVRDVAGRTVLPRIRVCACPVSRSTANWASSGPMSWQATQ